MKKFQSITAKLLLMIALAFLISSALIVMLANYQLTKIIDKSQNAIYTEKIEVIHALIEQYYERLQVTGLEETYREDFKTMAIKEIRRTYYKENNPSIYPFILDKDFKIVLYPALPEGFIYLQKDETGKLFLSEKNKEFTITNPDNKNWYIYQQFTPWEWYICYTVPQNLKYSDAYALRNMLIIVMSGIITVVLVLLSLLITRFTRPIIKLTNISIEISEGNFDQEIDLSGADEIGILAHSFSIMRDVIKEKIDDLKDNNEKLKLSEEKFRNLIESTTDWIWEVNMDGVFTYNSPQIEEILGYIPEEAIGKTPFDFMDPEEVEKISEIFINLVKEAKPIVMLENINIHKDGHEVIIETNGRPIFNTNGDVIGYRGVDRDISKRKQAEMDKAELQERLNHKDRLDAIGQLAGGIAHDFNNMLTGIMGAAELLQSQKENMDEKGSRYVEMIIGASTRAADLTAKLLSFSSKGHIGSTAVNIHTIIDDTVTILGNTIDKRISINVKKEAVDYTVIGDNSILQNVLLNLGINASHAMSNGGELLIITRNLILNKDYCDASLFEIEAGEYIEVEIHDTGCGISQENIKKIFEPYFTTKDVGKGTGMGLAAVYGTILDHHGAINVYSEPGTGTAFNIYLPSSKGTTKETESESELKLHSATGLILLVDDEKIIRTTGKLLLEDMGYTVIIAENGLEAIELFKEQYSEIDLVIMDMIMPKMNGREAFLKMRSIDSNCKILLSSGFTKDENLKILEKEGLTGFLHKPYRIHELSEILSKIFN